MIGEKLSPILEEIEATLWEFESSVSAPPQFTDDGLRAACKIFIAVLLDKAFIKMKRDGISQADAETQAENMGNEIHEIVFEYTGIDTRKMYGV